MKKDGIRLLLYLNAFFCCSILVLSCALIATAIIIKVTLSEYDDYLFYYGTVMTAFVLFTSVLSIVIAIWGCYTILRKSMSQILFFGIVLATNLIAHIILSTVYITFLEDSLSASVGTLFDEQILTYKENPQLSSLDFTQSKLQCCGKHEARDWFNYLPYIPASCCPLKSDNETIFCGISEIFVTNFNGCIPQLEQIPLRSVNLMRLLFFGLQICESLTLAISSWSYWLIASIFHKDNLCIKEKDMNSTISTHL